MRRSDLKAQEGRHSMFATNFLDHDLRPDFGYCGWDDHFSMSHLTCCKMQDFLRLWDMSMMGDLATTGIMNE